MKWVWENRWWAEAVSAAYRRPACRRKVDSLVNPPAFSLPSRPVASSLVWRGIQVYSSKVDHSSGRGPDCLFPEALIPSTVGMTI